ncbi:hypothetical protein [Bradyrhizobium sp. STM 3557]|uniref:hypothetical protein n=1 Tax=Bradyrhizobium sp. STM 3557 TaxID=578920 RepID=UPI00388F55BB
MTEKKVDDTHEDLLDRALEAFDRGGTGAAIGALSSIGDPAQAGTMFDGLARRLYNSRKDVANMISVANAGIAFCFDQAKRAENTETATKLKTAAKRIAFNAGANCWPGWGDDGIYITPDDIQSGLKFANLSHDLVRELQLGLKQEANAACLIGALRLAAGEPAAALTEFRMARNASESIGDAARMLMAEGYCAIARQADNTAARSAGAEELQFVLTRLRELGLDEAKFFAEQLVTAASILLSK